MLASVVASTYQNWEHILVDDGSTEDLKAVVQSFNDPRIRYFRFDENRGVPHGTNFALEMANGKYICLLSADEVITKEKLAEQVEYLETHPAVDCIWGLPGSGSDGVPYTMGPRPEWEQYAMKAHNRSREAWMRTLLQLENVPIGGASLMMKREVIKALGYMDEKLTMFSDHELYCRFFSRGYIGQILPYRWAIDKPVGPDSVRTQNQHGAGGIQVRLREAHAPVPAAKGHGDGRHPLLQPRGLSEGGCRFGARSDGAGRRDPDSG
jgi:glycosyltransferase involved in cell wall biosynthesis